MENHFLKIVDRALKVCGTPARVEYLTKSQRGFPRCLEIELKQAKDNPSALLLSPNATVPQSTLQ